jgi:hypothetical protein
VTLLRLSGNEAATLAAVEESSVEVRFEVIERLRLALSLQYGSAFIKQTLRDDCLVFALVVLAAIPDDSIIDEVSKQLLVIADSTSVSRSLWRR